MQWQSLEKVFICGVVYNIVVVRLINKFMYERPSYVSGTGEPDKNVILSLINTTEESLKVLEGKKDNVLPGALISVNAQINEKLRKLKELKGKLDTVDTPKID